MSDAPIPMLLVCPECGRRHTDEGEFATKPHHTHACQYCGMCWRPAIVPTVGVQFLPGFKNAAPPAATEAEDVVIERVAEALCKESFRIAPKKCPMWPMHLDDAKRALRAASGEDSNAE